MITANTDILSGSHLCTTLTHEHFAESDDLTVSTLHA
jgi:hypothetical protein